MQLYSIETGNMKIDGGVMFGVVPKAIWQKLYPADNQNLSNWALRCLLVETDNKKILIDTGLGNKLSANFLKHYHPNGEASLISSLQKNGFSPEDITDVIITHLHFDHVGGATKFDANNNIVPSFPNATYHISKSQWDNALNPNTREADAFFTEDFMPLQKHNVLNLISEETQLTQDITLKIYDGHTQGQIIPYINYKGRTLVYVADLFPSTAHIPMQYIMSYDIAPLQTLKDKQRFFTETQNPVLFFEHDIYTECCTLKQTPKGIRHDKCFSLKNFIKNPNI